MSWPLFSVLYICASYVLLFLVLRYIKRSEAESAKEIAKLKATIASYEHPRSR